MLASNTLLASEGLVLGLQKHIPGTQAVQSASKSLQSFSC